MAVPKFSNYTVNGEADFIGDALDSGFIRLYDGTQPADADTGITTQVLLAELTFGADAFGAAVAGLITANAVTSDPSANATGTATWARLVRSNGTTVVADGNVSTTPGAANVTVNTTSIEAGANVSCSAVTFQVSKG
jgi:hypothetical protein